VDLLDLTGRSYNRQEGLDAKDLIEVPLANVGTGLYLIRAYNAAGDRFTARLSVVR
jgi:hypothetical protein